MPPDPDRDGGLCGDSSVGGTGGGDAEEEQAATVDASLIADGVIAGVAVVLSGPLMGFCIGAQSAERLTRIQPGGP